MNTLCRNVNQIRWIDVFRNTIKSRPRNGFHATCMRRSYDPDGKTTVQILNHEAEMGLMIDSYSQMGFRLNNGMVVIGPMAIFPRSILSWNVSGPEKITEESLSLFALLEPKLDILVLGVGDSTRDPRLSAALIAFMRRHKINVEMLPTEQACATFNFLNAEGRYIAGALIPPYLLRHSDDDVIVTKLRQKRLYGPDQEDTEGDKTIRDALTFKK